MNFISSKQMDLLSAPLNLKNPVTVQILGICSALAVTVKLMPALVMGVSVIAVLAVSNMVVAFMRRSIPPSIRIIVQLIVVASMVILVDQILRAFLYDVSKQLSVYVGLIITNCIIMGRLEAFALNNNPWDSFVDGVGNGFGYAVILLIIAFMRELFGSGTLFNIQVIPQFFYDMGYMNNGAMIMPTMALILVGVIIWIQRGLFSQLNEKN